MPPSYVELALHTLHCWSAEELESLKDTISQIARQNASKITYDHAAGHQLFSITGADPKLQEQAFEALWELLGTKTPSKIRLPPTPFPQVSTPPSVTDRSGILIDMDSPSEPIPAMNAMSLEELHSSSFTADDRVRDPFDMYYFSWKQKFDLPTMVAHQHNCEATLSTDGRDVTITGKSATQVHRCVVKLKGMQEYYLRDRLDPKCVKIVPLVYGNKLEEFRLKFVPRDSHAYYVNQLSLLSSYPLELSKETNIYAIAKATYDHQAGKWSLAHGVTAPSSGQRLNPVQQRSAPQHAGGQGSPNHDWNRDNQRLPSPANGFSSPAQRKADIGAAPNWANNYPPSDIPSRRGSTANNMNQGASGKWDTLGTSYMEGDGSWPLQRASNQGSASNWNNSQTSEAPWSSTHPPQTSNQTSLSSRGSSCRRLDANSNRTDDPSHVYYASSPEASEQIGWAAPEFQRKPGDFPSLAGISSFSPNHVSKSPSPRPPLQGTVRRAEPLGWAAPQLNSNENDFPSLVSPSKSPKKSGMPVLPPVRGVEQLDPNLASAPHRLVRQSSGSPATRFDTADRSLVIGGSNSRDISITEHEFTYLNSRSNGQVRSAEGPAEMSSVGLETARLRDPREAQEDAKREYHRLLNLKASPSADRAAFSQRLRRHSMLRTVQVIRAGLAELRGHRKEIRLVGRLGSSMFHFPDPSACRKPWEFEELETLLMRKHNVTPLFFPVTTTESSKVQKLYGIYGAGKPGPVYYEVSCRSRINPTSSWLPTVVVIPPTAVIEKAVTPWETFGDVTWKAMDKDIDFEILLQAREGVISDTQSAMGRTDVKPFSTFRKKLSIGKQHITCKNVKDFLEVDGIRLKRTYSLEGPNGHTLLIHKVHKLKVISTPETDTVTGRLQEDDGQSWFEFELFSERVNGLLKSNLTLTAGLVADWDVNEIVGEDAEEPEALLELIKALMLTSSNCQTAFNQE